MWLVRCDQRLFGLVECWPLKEGGWGERQSTQRTGWITSKNDLARELSEVQGLDQSQELETRAPPCLVMHATERYPPRLAEAIVRCLSIHLRRKNGVPLDAVEVGIGPHVDLVFKMLTSMRLDYLHRSTLTNTPAWNFSD